MEEPYKNLFFGGLISDVYVEIDPRKNSLRSSAGNAENQPRTESMAAALQFIGSQFDDEVTP